ncbi:MAG TPA: hypothetical protein VLS48_08915, partial [Anaerolineales bacterium]|nr:hypothetical protein [Anaerolineales bacterium]
PCAAPSYHPGKCAQIHAGGEVLGVMGELHPLVQANYETLDAPVLAAEISLETLLARVQERYDIRGVAPYPPAVEDLAVIVTEDRPAAEVASVIREVAGELLTDLQLFDVYRGEQLGRGQKSLAYRLTYQSLDHTLNEKELLQARQRIVRALERELDAHLRS